jgi:hypothetical protein
MVWPAGRALVNSINGAEFEVLLQEKMVLSVLELGSGLLDVSGIAFGHILSSFDTINVKGMRAIRITRPTDGIPFLKVTQTNGTGHVKIIIAVVTFCPWRIGLIGISDCA